MQNIWDHNYTVQETTCKGDGWEQLISIGVNSDKIKQMKQRQVRRLEKKESKKAPSFEAKL